MMPSLDMAKLSKVVITSQDRQEFLGTIAAAQAVLFSSAGESVQERYPELAPFLDGVSDIAGTLEQMRLGLLALPVIRLTLAFEPERSFVEKVADAIRVGRGEHPFVLEIETDPAIVAGILISDGGGVIDKTLRKKLQVLDLQPILRTQVPSLYTV